MITCRHQDHAYRRALNDAYNRWLAEFCETDPSRLLGLALISLCNVEEGIEELRRAKEMGFRGVMFPGNPVIEDYDHACYEYGYDYYVYNCRDYICHYYCYCNYCCYSAADVATTAVDDAASVDDATRAPVCPSPPSRR